MWCIKTVHMFVICCTFPITPQANVVKSPFPKFFCLVCRHSWISLSQGLSTLDVKNTEKTMPNGFKPSLGAAENSTGLTVQCNYWGRLEHSM